MRRQVCVRWAAQATLAAVLVGALGASALGQAEEARTLTVELDRPLYHHDETLRGEIGGLIPAERIRIEHLDAFGRVIERLDTRKGRTATEPFSFRLNQPFTVLHRIVVTGEREARGQARFLLARRTNTWDRYHFIWTGRLKPEDTQALAALRAAGVTSAVARTPEEADAALTQDFRLLLSLGAHSQEPVTGPMFLGPDADTVAQQYAQTKDSAVLVRVPCLENAQARERWASTLLETVGQYGPYAPLGYSLGGRLWVTDPAEPLDVCFRPEAIAAWRQWLTPQYGSVRELNAEWETKFGDWSQVMPMTAAEVVARERAKPEETAASFAPWLMHRRFWNERFAQVVDALRGTGYRRDAAARIGFGGFASASAYGGYDVSRLLNVAGWLARREGTASALLLHRFNEKQRRVNRLPVPILMEVALAEGAAWRLWDSLLSGDRGAFLVGTPDASDQAATEKSLEEVLPVMSEINAGLGAIFATSDCALKTDPVALVYSQPSIGVHWMLDALALGDEWPQAAQPENSTWHRNLVAWLELLEDVGIHPDLIAADEIGTPAFQDARCRVLILPKTVALADEHADAIKQYVEGGGLLVADSQCGLFDEHGRGRAQPLLDDLFGVERSDRRSADARGRFTGLVAERAQERPAPDGLAMLGLPLDRSEFRPVEPSLRKAGAQPLVTFGETAALLARPPAPRSRTRGNSLYLNTTLLGYSQARTQQEGEALRQLMRNVLRIVELVPQVQVRDPETGRDLPLVAKRLFQHKGLMYLALVYPWGSEAPPSPEEQRVEVRLLERPYFYDMRAGEFKGRTEVFRTTLTPRQPRIYALLPYKVDEVTLQVRPSGRDLTFDVALRRREEASPTEDHVLRLELVGPDGRNRPSYTTLLVATSGRLTAQTRIGLEEPAGEWTIRAVDVVTGLEAEATFALEEAE